MSNGPYHPYVSVQIPLVPRSWQCDHVMHSKCADIRCLCSCHFIAEITEQDE